jgi:ribosome-dependent ATPase
VLILDEPTSGVDPVARDSFWQYLIDLSRDEGVTIFLSTHFMNEAERCDRISLMHAGEVLAVGTAKELTQRRGMDKLEDAFIAYLEDAAGKEPGAKPIRAEVPLGIVSSGPGLTRGPSAHELVPWACTPSGTAEAVSTDGRIKSGYDGQEAGLSRSTKLSLPSAASRFDLRRLWAYARRETMEILRDPIRLTFSFLGPLILMLTVGYGISFDVEHLAYAAFDQDQTNESHELLENFSGSRYFGEHRDVSSEAELDHRLKSGELKLALQIPTNFGKDLLTDKRPELSVWLDGAMPFRAETASSYVQGLAQTYLIDQAARGHIAGLRPLPVNLEARFKYNHAFKSVYQTIPSTIMLVLILIPAMMTAVGVAREKETGSIANFRSTPITGVEFLLGKQLPYVAIGLASFMTLLLVAVYLFGVPVKGSVAALLAGVFVYIGAATAFGLLVSCFTSTQIAAIFTTTILTLVIGINFSGLLVPFSSLSGAARWIGLGFPSGWFTQISLGAFTKGLGFAELWADLLVLVAFALGFVAAATLILRKQEA